MVKPHVISLVVAAALGVTCAARAEGDGGRAAFVKASKYFEAEEYEAALPYFRKAYEQSGARPATAFGLAQCLRSLKRYDEAIPLFEEYLASDPDNAASVRETLGLLREIAERQRKKQEAAEAKKQAELEEKKRQDAEEAKKRADAEAKAEAEAAAAAAAVAPPPAPPPAPAPEPAVVAPPEPEVEEGSIVSSPVFWIVTGAAVVGGAIAVGVVATRSGGEYGGNTGRVLAPLRGVR